MTGGGEGRGRNVHDVQHNEENGNPKSDAVLFLLKIILACSVNYWK